MELVDNLLQLVALCGFEENGVRRAIVICAPGEIQKSLQVLFEGYPEVAIVGQYALHIRSQEQAHYTREEVRPQTK